MGHGSSTSKPLPPPSEAAREAAEARREAEKRQRGTGDGSGDAGNDGASQPKRSRRSDEGRESSSNNADAEPTGPSGNARNNGASEPEISRHSDEEEEQVEESHSSRNASARPSGASVSRETLTERRSLIAEQNRAFENSLRADQQKAMEKLEKERAVAVKEKKKQEKIAAFRKRKREARESLSEEPDAEDPGVITLAFHMPSGRSIKRGFRQTDTLKALYQFVCQLEEIQMEFELLRFPNVIISDSNSTLEEYNLKKEMIYICMRPDASTEEQE